MRVHITGFEQKEKEDIKTKILSLGLTPDENFTFNTDMLVCDSIMAQKYRIAKILNTKIVTKHWLLESFKSRRLLETKDYEFGIFEGLRIHFHGFDVFKLDTLKETVRRHNGILVKDLNRILSNEETANFIVVKEGADTERLIPMASRLFCVTLGWLYNCLKYERFIYPDNFLLPFCRVSLSKINLKIKIADLDKLINETESNAEPYNILNNCLFYLHPIEGRPDELEIAFKLVSLMSGLSTRKRLKNVTHVVANSMDFEEREKFEQKGSVFFVNYTYLKDCLLYKKRLLEIEYPSKIVEARPQSGTGVRTDSRGSTNGTFFKSFKTANCTKMPEFKSFLFENVLFFCDKSLKNYRDLTFKIFENSGSIIMNFDKNVIKNREIFYVIEDGCDEERFEQLRRELKAFSVTFVAGRWVDYCLERKVVVRDIQESRLPHLLPFAHAMPISEFAELRFGIKGFNSNEKYVLEEIIKILGGTLTKFDPNDSEQYKIFNGAKELEKGGERCKSINWIFDCLSQGKLIN